MGPEVLIPILVGAFAALVGGGSVFALALKRTWSGSDAADAAFIRGHSEAKADHREDMRQLREEFGRQFDELDARHRTEISALSDHVEGLHRALGQLVRLVAPEHMAEATAILVELGMPKKSPTHTTTTTTVVANEGETP